MRTKLSALFLGLALAALPARAQITSITFSAPAFSPPETTPVFASQAVLSVLVNAAPASYQIDVINGGTAVSTTQVTKSTPLGTTDTFRVAVPLAEGSQTFQVRVTQTAFGSASLLSGNTPSITRDLLAGVSAISLDSISPPTRATKATKATLFFTVSGSSSKYLITVLRNSATQTTVTTGQAGPGQVTVPLLADMPNTFQLQAQSNETFPAPQTATSNILTIVQQTTAPTILNPIVSFPPLPTGDAMANVQGQTAPFALVEVINSNGDRFATEADILGSWSIQGVFLPLLPPGPTTTNLTIKARDAAGNIGPSVLVPVTRTAASPRFDLLQLFPSTGSFVKPGVPMVIRGAVDGGSAPYTVNLQITAGAGAFAKDLQETGLADGAAFQNEVFLSPLISNPNGDVVYSVQAQVVSTAGTSDQITVGQVTLDASDPPPPSLATRFNTRLFTLSKRFTVEGTAERFSTVQFGPLDGTVFIPLSGAHVDSTPVLDGGEFKDTVDISTLPDGSYSLPASTVATSGRTAPSSTSLILFTKDTTAPLISNVLVNGLATGTTVDKKAFVRPGTIQTLTVVTNEPMSQAPDVLITERGSDALPAALTASDASKTQFTYAYSVTPQATPVTAANLHDGPVDVVVAGGADLAGNPVAAVRLAGLFIKDSLAPVVVSVTPASGSTTNRPPSRIRFTILENPLSITPASGVNTGATQVTVAGPIETSPGTLRPGTVDPLDPQTVDFVFSPGTVLPEGTYQVTVQFQDNAGNTDTNVFTFIIDTTPIDARFALGLTPTNGSCVSRATMPQSGGHDTVSIKFDPGVVGQIDTTLTTMTLQRFCPDQALIPGTQSFVASDTLRLTLTSNLRADGSDDGEYVATTLLTDKAGNTTPFVIRSFVYDTQPPFVLDGNQHSLGTFGITTEQAFFPATAAVVGGGPLRTVEGGVADAVAMNGYTGCGVNTSLTTGTSLILTLVGRFPTTTLPLGASTTNTPVLTSVTKFTSVEPPIFSPCFAGVRRARVMLELRVDPVSGTPTGLATGGSMDGIYEMLLTPIDGAGNVGTPVRSRFVYDTVPPTVTVDNITNDQFIQGNTLVLTGTAVDNPKPPSDVGEGVARIQVRLERATVSGVTTQPPLIDFSDATLAPNMAFISAATPIKWRFTGALPQYTGTARLILRVTDVAGNVTNLIRDLQVATGRLPAPKLLSPPDNSHVASPITTFAWSQVAGASGYLVTITDPNGNVVTARTPAQTNQVPVSLLGRPDGNYDWIVQVIDTQGALGQKPNAFQFGLDTIPPRITSLFGFDPTIPDQEHGGVVLDNQVRVGIKFSKPMDNLTTPTVTVTPANPLSPAITLTQISYSQDQWRGAADIPPAPDAPDVNGLAQVVVSRARDLAGNPLAVTGGFFEIDIGPAFEIRAFANPIDRRELLFHVKGQATQGGAPVALGAPPFVRITQAGGTPQILAMHKVAASVWAGPYSVDPTQSGTATIEVNGTDTLGNTDTRLVHFFIQDVVARSFVRVPLPSSRATLGLAPGALRAPAILVPPSLVPLENLAPPGPRAEVIAPRALGGVLPEGAAGAATTVRVDVATLGLGAAAPPLARMGIYRMSGSQLVYQPTRRTGTVLEATLDALGPLVVAADVASPEVQPAFHVDAAGQFTPAPGDLDVDFLARDGGSGVDPATVAIRVDGRQIAATYDSASGQAHATLPAGLASGPHALELIAADRAGNVTQRHFQAQAPAPLDVVEFLPWPNPTGTVSTLRYTLTAPAQSAGVDLYDIAGRRVRHLSGTAGAGANDAVWDLDDGHGARVASGIYIARLRVQGLDGRSLSRTAKIAVLR